ncbi:MAG: hypothetical protein ABI566_07110 [Pseudolysinimonas sp.]
MDVRAGRHIEYYELVEKPAYRVHFWHVATGLAANLDAHILTDAADVQEALDWAGANSEGRPWEMFALFERLPSLASNPESWWVRLHGTSPLVPDSPSKPQTNALSFEHTPPSDSPQQAI